MYFEVLSYGVRYNQNFEDLKEDRVNKLKNKFDLLNNRMNFLMSQILINMVANNNDSEKK